MTQFLADENFNNDIVRGLHRELPFLDIVRIQDLNMAGWADPDILEWAASVERVILTHDIGDMAKYSYDRIRSQLPMPGIVEVPDRLPTGSAINDLKLMIECSLEAEWENRIRYLPIR